MITKKQLQLLGVFQKNIFKEYSFKEIKAYSKEKSNSVIQRATRQFKTENLVKERKVGTSKLYSLDLSNTKVFLYLELLCQDRLPSIAQKSLRIVSKELSNIIFYSLVVFGSYTEGKASDRSDFDLAIFIPDKSHKKNIDVALHSASNKSLLKLDYHIITAPEMLEMLKADYENVGKEIARKNLPVHNSQLFYNLIMRGAANGFNPVP
ncbi:MAG: nucleotidyltransferase domain-containing protein [Candidatus Woesearchaeota archaeon]